MSCKMHNEAEVFTLLPRFYVGCEMHKCNPYDAHTTDRPELPVPTLFLLQCQTLVGDDDLHGGIVAYEVFGVGGGEGAL